MYIYDVTHKLKKIKISISKNNNKLQKANNITYSVLMKTLIKRLYCAGFTLMLASYPLTRATSGRVVHCNGLTTGIIEHLIISRVALELSPTLVLLYYCIITGMKGARFERAHSGCLCLTRYLYNTRTLLIYYLLK